MQSKRMYRSRRSQRLYSLDSDRGKASPLRKKCWPRCGMHSAAMRFAGNRMLKKSVSGVLASLRGSTYRSVRLASSLAAALPDGLFEHPAWHYPIALEVGTIE